MEREGLERYLPIRCDWVIEYCVVSDLDCVQVLSRLHTNLDNSGTFIASLTYALVVFRTYQSRARTLYDNYSASKSSNSNVDVFYT